MKSNERGAVTAVEDARAKWGSEGVLAILDAMEEVAAGKMRSHLAERRVAPIAMTASEAAKSLSVSVSTVYKLAESGDLPTLRIGRSVRFPVEALRRYVEVHTTYARYATRFEAAS